MQNYLNAKFTDMQDKIFDISVNICYYYIAIIFM